MHLVGYLYEDNVKYSLSKSASHMQYSSLQATCITQVCKSHAVLSLSSLSPALFRKTSSCGPSLLRRCMCVRVRACACVFVVTSALALKEFNQGGLLQATVALSLSLSLSLSLHHRIPGCIFYSEIKTQLN
jgi:hypothetical protein